MAQMVMAGSYYRHPRLGNIKIKVSAQARSVRARWDGPELLITVPRNYPVEEYDRFIEEYADKILEMRPQQRFWLGQCIDAGDVDFTITIGPAELMKNYDAIVQGEQKSPQRGKKVNYYIYLSERFRTTIAESAKQKFINKCLLNAAAKATGLLILPLARELADKTGHHPIGWDIKHVKHRLGSCDSKGIITLGPRIIFLPQDLREFIIFHELAHLSEMNHSQAFHKICNEYCHGNEAQLSARVKAFQFPVF